MAYNSKFLILPMTPGIIVGFSWASNSTLFKVLIRNAGWIFPCCNSGSILCCSFFNNSTSLAFTYHILPNLMAAANPPSILMLANKLKNDQYQLMGFFLGASPNQSCLIIGRMLTLHSMKM